MTLKHISSTMITKLII